MTKTLNQTLAEIEDAQASLVETLKDSKRLLDRSQQLLDCRRKQIETRREKA